MKFIKLIKAEYVTTISLPEGYFIYGTSVMNHNGDYICSISEENQSKLREFLKNFDFDTLNMRKDLDDEVEKFCMSLKR